MVPSSAAYSRGMRFFSSKPASIPTPAESPPRAVRTRSSRPAPTPSSARRSPARGPTARRPRSSASAASGAPRRLLAAPRRRDDGRRLRRWPHPEPDVRGGLLRPDRPRRGRPRRLRPGEDHLRAAPQDVLGEPRPDPGHAPGQRHGHPVPLDHPDRRRRAAPARRGGRDEYQARLSARPATARSRPRSRRPARSTTPRTTTSSTSTRTPAATARTTPPA